MTTKTFTEKEIASLKKKACYVIDNLAGELNVVSQEIWQNPELNFKEYHAHKTLTNFLEGHGFKVERSYHMDTAFRARSPWANRRGPNIAVLCEYDALPEVDHGCGHNLIAEVGVAAVLGIKAALEEKGVNFGNVTVLGTPAEEGGGGKIDLIKAGAFNDVDVAMMSHPGSFAMSLANNLAIIDVTVIYRGRASHASAFPWKGLNALDAAVAAYTNLSLMRQQMKRTWRVHGVIVNGGAKANIIPEKSELNYMLRAPTMAEVNQLREKATKCFEAAAAATGCKVTINWSDKPYDNVITNDTIRQLYEANSLEMGVVHKEDTFKFSTGSTDMGNVTHVVPGIHPHSDIGTKAPAHTKDFCQVAGSVNAQAPSIREGKILAMTAIDILCQPKLLETIKRQFQEDLKKEEEE